MKKHTFSRTKKKKISSRKKITVAFYTQNFNNTVAFTLERNPPGYTTFDRCVAASIFLPSFFFLRRKKKIRIFYCFFFTSMYLFL